MKIESVLGGCGLCTYTERKEGQWGDLVNGNFGQIPPSGDTRCRPCNHYTYQPGQFAGLSNADNVIERPT